MSTNTNNCLRAGQGKDDTIIGNATTTTSSGGHNKRSFSECVSASERTKPSSTRPTKQAKQETKEEEEEFQILDAIQWLRNRDNHRQRHIVQEPEEVTCYSITSSYTEEEECGGVAQTIKYGSREQLRRYKRPSIPPPTPPSSRSNNSNNINKCIDLSQMIEQWIPPSEDDKPIVETILDTLEEEEKSAVPSSSRQSSTFSADVITFRNNLNKIGGTVFNPRNDWEMECTLYRNNNNIDTLYLDILPTTSQQQQQQPAQSSSKEEDSLQYKLQYYGYRFESVCTGRESHPVNCNNEFCSVVSLQVGTKRILMAAEIDCCNTTDGKQQSSSTTNAVRDYIELKTMRGPLPQRGNNQREYNNLYRYRYPKYWLQSYLAGIPTIVIGERTDEGILVNVRHIQTTQMYREAISYFCGDTRKCGWNPTTIINFIYDVLEICRQKCNNNNTVNNNSSRRTLHVQYKSQPRQIVGRFRKTDDDDGSNSGDNKSNNRNNDCIGKRLAERWQRKEI